MSAPNSSLNVYGTLQTSSSTSFQYTPPAVVNTSACASNQVVALNSTPTLVTLPAGSVMFGVIPQSLQNTADINIKFHTGDSGFAINATYGAPCIGVPSSSTTSFYLWSAAGCTVNVVSG